MALDDAIKHQYDSYDPVYVKLRHRFYPNRTEEYNADCPLDAYLMYRPLRREWLIERMQYFNGDEVPEY